MSEINTIADKDVASIGKIYPKIFIYSGVENEILSENSRSGIEFIIGMRVLTAKHYIDNLAE